MSFRAVTRQMQFQCRSTDFTAHRSWRIPILALLLTVIATAAGAELPLPNGPIGVTVIIENQAPENGTWLTPVWVGFHDGTFDTYDLSQPAGEALERLAEDGNTGPISDQFDAAGVGTNQAVMPSDEGIPPLAPGESATMKFVLNSNDPESRYFSYASMVIPSNDAFSGNDDPEAHRIFDNSGNFLGAYFLIPGSAVRDAGTEVNDEIPEHTAFFGQQNPDTGVDENGVVHPHPGYLPPGSGGILDDPMFANADFTQPGYDVGRVIIVRSDTVVSAGNVAGTWTAAGSPYIVEGDITVPAGETLKIEAGVVVYFTSWYALQVHGRLEALGTREDPILFTATPHGPGEPAWRGVRFENAPDAGIMEWCIVENGHVAGTTDTGGAIAATNSDPVVRNCTLRNCLASDYGAAVYLENSSAVIEGCTIEDNMIAYPASGAGGGIYANGGSPQILDNLIRNNQVRVDYTFGPASGAGGGICLFNCTALVAGNQILNNQVYATGNVGTSARGGGIYSRSGASVFSNNTLSGNMVNGYTEHEGGGFYFYTDSPTLKNNIIEGCVGGGVFFGSYVNADVAYNDFYGNDTDFFGPSAPDGLGEITMNNNNGDPCDAFYNIYLDPLFVDVGAGDVHLQPDSPCIDAGDPESDPDPDGSIADIGALYFDHRTNSVIGPDSRRTPNHAYLLLSRPEPFRIDTNIHYELSQSVPVRLTLHDVTGRTLRTLVDEPQAAGPRSIHFDGRDDAGRSLPPGVYFYRISTPMGVESRRMTITR